MSEIGGNGIGGQEFADHLTFLNQTGDIDLIDVLINSPGGSVQDGLSMFWAILKSPIPVNTTIIGDAASMAGMVALAGKKVSIVDFGKIMLHAPGFPEGFNPDEQQQKGLDAAMDQIVTLLMARMKKTDTAIRKMLSDGDTWFSAKEAKAAGLVDEVIKVSEEIGAATEFTQIVALLNPKEITYTPVIINSITMKDLAKLLNINAGSEESLYIEAVQAILDGQKTAKEDLATANDKLTKSDEIVTAQKLKIEEFEAKAVTFEQEQVDKTVDKMVEDGKLKKDKSDDIKAHYKSDIVGLQLLSDNIPKKSVDIIAQLAQNGGSQMTEDEQKRTFRDWEEKHPKDLQAWYAKDPKAVEASYEKEYKVKMRENYYG